MKKGSVFILLQTPMAKLLREDQPRLVLRPYEPISLYQFQSVKTGIGAEE
jgi:hypothetical protein